MTALLSAAATVTDEIELEFPNLFGGTSINYYRGFQIFGISIYWYGILITIGVILAYLYAMYRLKDFGLNKDRVFDVVFAALIGGFLGARIYYCVFTTLDPNSGMKYDFITTFTSIRDGGLAIYGGIIGGFLTGYVACRIRKVKFFTMCDIAAMGFLIGQCIGRWGNFINQEAYGATAPDNWLFGMTGTIISTQTEAGTLVHPCFLYESVWCLLGFIALHFYSKKLRSFDGEIVLMYVAWYGFGRAIIEGMRTDSLMAGPFRVSQLVGGISFVVAIALLIAFKIITEKKKIPLYVNSEECAAQLALDDEKAKSDEEKRAAKKAAKEKTAESILADNADEIEPVTDGMLTETETAETETAAPAESDETAADAPAETAGETDAPEAEETDETEKETESEDK